MQPQSIPQITILNFKITRKTGRFMSSCDPKFQSNILTFSYALQQVTYTKAINYPPPHKLTHSNILWRNPEA